MPCKRFRTVAATCRTDFSDFCGRRLPFTGNRNPETRNRLFLFVPAFLAYPAIQPLGIARQPHRRELLVDGLKRRNVPSLAVRVHRPPRGGEQRRDFGIGRRRRRFRVSGFGFPGGRVGYCIIRRCGGNSDFLASVIAAGSRSRRCVVGLRACYRCRRSPCKRIGIGLRPIAGRAGSHHQTLLVGWLVG